MANEEHLAILKQGVDAWNRWREEHLEVCPDLRGANLNWANLKGVSLSRAFLREAFLLEADLREANLSGAVLLEADLSRANLSWAVLLGAHLSGADLRGTILNGVILSNANLRGANLRWAELSKANLRGADLSGADLSRTDLSRADLSGADLSRADLSQADLREADLSGAIMLRTVLNELDLRQVKRLETVRHGGPSYVGIQTIYESQGQIPEVFLRGAGVPDQFIEYTRSLVGKPIEYYSCFISYSSKDEEFVRRLYVGLQSNNIRCWFAPEDLPWGEKIRPGIDQAIRKHEKLLLVLSEHSVASDWVEQEVETASERERLENKLVLFPVRLDDAVMQVKDGWPAHLRRTRNIGDFTGWETQSAYQKAFERLLRDLKATSTSTSPE